MAFAGRLQALWKGFQIEGGRPQSGSYHNYLPSLVSSSPSYYVTTTVSIGYHPLPMTKSTTSTPPLSKPPLVSFSSSSGNEILENWASPDELCKPKTQPLIKGYLLILAPKLSSNYLIPNLCNSFNVYFYN